MMAHTSLGTAPIAIFGDESQKKKYLPPLARGEMLGAFGLTEPNAGSDAGNTQTTASSPIINMLLMVKKSFVRMLGRQEL